MLTEKEVQSTSTLGELIALGEAHLSRLDPDSAEYKKLASRLDLIERWWWEDGEWLQKDYSAEDSD